MINKHSCQRWSRALAILILALVNFKQVHSLFKSKDDFYEGNLTIVLSVLKTIAASSFFALVFFGEGINERNSEMPKSLWVWMTIQGLSSGIHYVTSGFSTEAVIDSLLVVTCTAVYFVTANQANVQDESKSNEVSHSFWSRITFWWVTPLIHLAREKKDGIVVTDIPNFPVDDQTGNVTEKLIETWNEEKTKHGSAGIIKVLIKNFGASMILGSVVFEVVQSVFYTTNPLVLKSLMQFMKDKNSLVSTGVLLVFLKFLSSNIQTLVSTNKYGRNDKILDKIHSSVKSMMYRKSLRITNSERKETSVGQIFNLMNGDVYTISSLLIYTMNSLWSTPIEVIGAVYFIYQELGTLPTVAGVTVMIIARLLHTWSSTLSRGLWKERWKISDERSKVTNEILSGIKIIKLYAWEESFLKLMSKIRGKEMECQGKLVVRDSLTSFLSSITSFLVALISFWIYTCYDESGVLNAEKAFVSLAGFRMLQSTLGWIPEIVRNIIKARISATRLNKFLNSKELDDYIERTAGGPAVEISDASFSWINETSNDDEKDKQSSPVEPQITLRKITTRIEKGSLTAVVGVVGSGKSSFLNCIIGDIDKLEGSVRVSSDIKTIGYVPQQAWILNKSLKENILFGQDCIEEKYQQVIECCQLLPDLDLLPAGDESEIGEKGMNLSGGQKQRVSLSRACYADCDLYLLDDPLSAVDAHVSKKLFRKVISSKTGILKNKTRILVTNDLSFLPSVDNIIVMTDGTVAETGSYQDLIESNGDFSVFLKEFSNPSSPGIGRQDSVPFEPKKKKDDESQESAKLTQDEDASDKQVNYKVFFEYLHHIPKLLLLTYFVSDLAGHLLHKASSYSLSLWKDTDNKNTNGLMIYGVIGVTKGLLYFCESVTKSKISMKTSSSLHDKVFLNVLRAPMSFFETNPIGRTLTRVSQSSHDGVVNRISRFVSNSLDLFLSIILVCSNNPYLLVLISLASYCYYWIQKIYNPFSKQIGRIRSRINSPVYSFFHESLAGVSSIRSYRKQESFTEDLESKIDKSVSCQNVSSAASQWVSNLYFLLGSIITASVTLFAVLHRDHLDPGIIGLLATTFSEIGFGIMHFIREFFRFEKDLIDIEETLEYSKLQSEGDWITEDSERKPQNWPSKGRIDFENYSTRYRSGLDLILRDMNITIYPGERIGVVGRTGAGKSSLSLSLMRVLEAASGCIKIDDVDISTIGLHDLRKAITVIPQDPVLFSGSIRFNLDPFNESSDEKVWKSLEDAHLKTFIKKEFKEKGLDSLVTEGGDNFSGGQKQLLCLARVLMRKESTKILILDEATASVDIETDSLIQKTIREQFGEGCTIITIAHRIHTILDSSRVIVMNEGKVVEFDDPALLLKDQSSLFASLSKSAGIKSYSNTN